MSQPTLNIDQSSRAVPIPKKVSVVLFYDSKGNILLQDRRERSKWGEEYGFFGGGVEMGESPKQTIRRELKEELELEDVKLTLFKRYMHVNPVTGVTVDRTVYLADMPDLKRLVCHEGKPEVRTFRNSLELKMIPGFDVLLNEIYQALKLQNKTV